MKIICKALIILSYGLLIFSEGFGQALTWGWAKSIGAMSFDLGTSIALDASGNEYTAGYFMDTVDFDPGPNVFNLISIGNPDIFVAKFDGSGNFIWAKAMGGTYIGDNLLMVLDASANIYLTGSFDGTEDFNPGSSVYNLTSAGGSDIFILKLNSSGNFIWAKSIGGTGSDGGTSIAINSSNIFITGDFNDTVDFDSGIGISNLTSAGDFDIFVCKLDLSGNFIWAKSMGGAFTDYGISIALESSGNIYIAGDFQGTSDFDPDTTTVFGLTSSGSYDFFISKLNSSGNFLWTKQIGGLNADVVSAIAVDASGNVHATGSFNGTVDFDPNSGVFNLTSIAASDDIFISKLSSSGNFLWGRSIGSSDNDAGTCIIVDAGGKVYTGGFFSGTADFDPGGGISNLTSAGNWDFFISKLNSSGNYYWAKATGGAHGDIVRDMAISTSGNMYVIGDFGSFSMPVGSTILTNASSFVTTPDVFIAKTSVVTGVENLEKINDVSFSPNPTTSFCTVTAPTFTNSILTFYDLTGRALLQQSFNIQLALNLANFPAGIYFIEVSDKYGNSVKGKIIKE